MLELFVVAMHPALICWLSSSIISFVLSFIVSLFSVFSHHFQIEHDIRICENLISRKN